MSLSRITTRLTRTVVTQFNYSPVLFSRSDRAKLSSFSGQFLLPHTRQVIPGEVSFLHRSALNSSPFQWSGFSSSATPEPNDKEAAQPENKEAAASVSNGKAESGSDTDSDSETNLSKAELVKLVTEKEKELESMKDKVLRTYAEMENVKDRQMRESEKSKKFAIQDFAKRLLDVADNLGRASTTAKDSFSKIDTSTDTTGAAQQLKILLQGVEMTEKQLAEVFKKFGLEKYDPMNEEFDPNRHNAVFQVPDASKPAGQVAVVLKPGYMLHERIIRPAEVGVTVNNGGA